MIYLPVNNLINAQVYECVSEWSNDRVDSNSVLSESVLECLDKLLDCVRFPCLPVPFLIEIASKNKVV